MPIRDRGQLSDLTNRKASSPQYLEAQLNGLNNSLSRLAAKKELNDMGQVEVAMQANRRQRKQIIARIKASAAPLTLLFYGTGGTHAKKHDNSIIGVLAQQLGIASNRSPASGSDQAVKRYTNETETAQVIDGPAGKMEELYRANRVRSDINDTPEINSAIEQAVNQIKAKFDAMDPRPTAATPLVINLMGHSRGSVNALRVANQIAKLEGYEHIQFNLLLLDPVAGPGLEAHEDAQSVPANVKSCLCVVSRHEDRGGFPSLVDNLSVKNQNTTRFLEVLVPGNHTSPRHAEGDSVSQRAVAGFVGALSHRWLQEYAGGLVEGLPPEVSGRNAKGKAERYSLGDNVSLSDLYSRCIENAEKIRAESGYSYTDYTQSGGQFPRAIDLIYRNAKGKEVYTDPAQIENFFSSSGPINRPIAVSADSFLRARANLTAHYHQSMWVLAACTLAACTLAACSLVTVSVFFSPVILLGVAFAASKYSNYQRQMAAIEKRETAFYNSRVYAAPAMSTSLQTLKNNFIDSLKSKSDHAWFSTRAKERVAQAERLISEAKAGDFRGLATVSSRSELGVLLAMIKREQAFLTTHAPALLREEKARADHMHSLEAALGDQQDLQAYYQGMLSEYKDRTQAPVTVRQLAACEKKIEALQQEIEQAPSQQFGFSTPSLYLKLQLRDDLVPEQPQGHAARLGEICQELVSNSPEHGLNNGTINNLAGYVADFHANSTNNLPLARQQCFQERMLFLAEYLATPRAERHHLCPSVVQRYRGEGATQRFSTIILQDAILNLQQKIQERVDNDASGDLSLIRIDDVAALSFKERIALQQVIVDLHQQLDAGLTNTASLAQDKKTAHAHRPGWLSNKLGRKRTEEKVWGAVEAACDKLRRSPSPSR
jgi:hypothetical protein